MTYELARQLKDAGFPASQHSYCNKCESDSQFGNYHCPTLSELIEACGESFRSLIQHSGDRGSSKWCAKAGKFAGGFLKNGETPEEAVAKLWMALNRKVIL